MPCAFPPTKSGIVSRYGLRHGRVTGALRQHAGVDFRARRGDPVFAVVDGTIALVGRDEPHGRVVNGRFEGSALSGYGNCIVLFDGARSYAFYAHLDSVRVQQGQQVRRGQLIGTVGSTSNGKFDGSATSLSPGRPMGAHSHFEVKIADRMPYPGRYGAGNVDPQQWLAERGVTYGFFGGGPSINCPAGLAGLGAPAGSSLQVELPVDGAVNEYEPSEPEILLDWAPTIKWTLGGVAAAGIIIGSLAWLGSSRRR